MLQQIKHGKRKIATRQLHLQWQNIRKLSSDYCPETKLYIMYLSNHRSISLSLDLLLFEYSLNHSINFLTPVKEAKTQYK